MTTPTPSPKTTTAYLVQAMLSFGVALAVVVIGELYLPVSGWVRAFLALGTVFLVSSSFTLAKCVRDQQESGTMLSRLDQARLEQLLAEFDPFDTGLPRLPRTTPAPAPAAAAVPSAAGAGAPLGLPPMPYPRPR